MTSGKPGRPRSEEARLAVMYAVDDLLVEVGYSALTMKGIAERAGVGRQTLYRWWSTKAEILLEACTVDAAEELRVHPTGDPVEDVRVYVSALAQFLTMSPAGIAYRALLGEALYDEDVAALLRSTDVLRDSALAVLDQANIPIAPSVGPELAVSFLVGPILHWTSGHRDLDQFNARQAAQAFVAAVSCADHR